jgi:hypothetical protein
MLDGISEARNQVRNSNLQKYEQINEKAMKNK